jgi:hypothetical protein
MLCPQIKFYTHKTEGNILIVYIFIYEFREETVK